MLHLKLLVPDTNCWPPQLEKLPAKSAARELLDTALLTVHIGRLNNLRMSRRSKLAYTTCAAWPSKYNT